MSSDTNTNRNAYPFQNPALPLEDRVTDLVSRFTLEEKVGLMLQYQIAVERLGVKAYKHGTEAAHGVAWLGEATGYPQPIGLGCTWDTELMQRVGSAIGDEARGFYKRNPEANGLTLWAPTVDMERDPRWGRTEEAYGEDPVLTGKLASALVQGIQGDHPKYLKAVATLKHFIANNNEIGRGDASVSIDPRNLREYYLKAFEIPFKEGGAQSMMTAYNAINGIPANLSPDVKGIVKQEWGMDGFVVSDAYDVSGTVRDHGYLTSYKEAVARSVREGGIDSLTDDGELMKLSLREALAEGLLTESDLDEALRNTFRVRFRLGEFDPASDNPYASIDESIIMHPDHAKLSREATGKAIVLLKNENNMLPLSSEMLKKVAVIGPLGNIVYRDWYSGELPYAVTPLEGILQRLGVNDLITNNKVIFTSGTDRIKLKSTSNGQYVQIQSNGQAQLIANGQKCEEAAVFELTDWGWGSHTLIAEQNGRYVTTDDRSVKASADYIWEWFTKEVFLAQFVCGEGEKIESQKGEQLEEKLKNNKVENKVVEKIDNKLEEKIDEKVIFSTWNNVPVTVRSGTGEVVVGSGAAEETANEINVAGAASVVRGEGEISAEVFELEKITDKFEEAKEAASEAEVAIVFVGNHPLINGKETMDRPDITLPAAQEQLIKEVMAVNPNTIVVVIGSYPFAINWVDEHVPAVLYSSHAGQELGNAIADVLFGDVNPAGRLNMTWYKSVDQLPAFMDYDIIKGERTYQYFKGEVLYPFGHGLSYTKFSYDSISLDRQKLDTLNITVTLTNTGNCDGEEVVQLYSHMEQSRVKRPLKQLLAFRRVNLVAGQSIDIEFEVPLSQLAIWDVTRERFCIESGTYSFMAGSSSAILPLHVTCDLEGAMTEVIPPRNLKQPTKAINYDDYEGVQIIECMGSQHTKDIAFMEDIETLNVRSAVEVQEQAGWFAFKDVDFGDGVRQFKLRAASAQEQAVAVELRLQGVNGILVGKLEFTGTGVQQWQDYVIDIEDIEDIVETNGKYRSQDVYIVINGRAAISMIQFLA
ncbi:beta-glucosidase [Paenibacillus turicensis]|uniref:Beta-glucosidase n=1 Tax=Paenibacillus turicensis TaxID=160487 RepID=A0ABS4FRX1_9BACL|nr:beta-glucosidase [Paenibacillus turicensis]